jgi:hypothetical protein
VDDAPTQGKFFVKLQKGDSHVMWGNFQTSWSGTELMQYSRGLYGAQFRHRSEEATTYGEKQHADRRLRRRSGNAGLARRIPRHRRLAVLPAPPGHHAGFGARLDRGA